MSNTLTDIYQDISARDALYIEKHAEQQHQAGLVKLAEEEEDAAGRITARGFADELHKLAGNDRPATPPATATKMKLAPPVKVKPPKVGGGDTGGSYGLPGGRAIKAPPVPSLKGKGQFGKGDTVTGAGEIKSRPTFKPPGQ